MEYVKVIQLLLKADEELEKSDTHLVKKATLIQMWMEMSHYTFLFDKRLKITSVRRTALLESIHSSQLSAV